MTQTKRAHREPALARRDALLDAAVQLVAEVGAGGTTHRAVAGRAGVPLSSTSYFFDSLDELLVAALRRLLEQQLADVDLATASMKEQTISASEAVALMCDVLLSEPDHHVVAQFEIYLEASRRAELRDDVQRMIQALETYACAVFTAAGLHRPANCARMFIALADGFALQRVALPGVPAHSQSLRDALLDLVIAHRSTDEEHQRRRAELDSESWDRGGRT